MLSLLRRWILPSPSSSQISTFFSPHYLPATTLSTHRISHFSTYPPLHSDNKPSNPGAKPLNKPPPPPESPSTSPSTAAPPVLPSDDPLKPVISPAWNELMSILSKHVYDSSWTAKDQARYSHVITRYPYISPETQYSTGVPSPVGMQPREACLRAAEEAFFADYRPLSADVAETFVENDEDMKEMESLELGVDVVQVSMNGQSYVLRISPGEEDTAVREKISGIMEMTSTRRKRHTKMKNHKRRKLRRRQRTEKIRMGKI